MSSGREEFNKRFVRSDGGNPTYKHADFSKPNNPFSQAPIEATSPSNLKSRNSGGTADILPKERAKASFNVSTMTTIIDGSKKNTARRKFFAGSVEDEDAFSKYSLTRPEIFYESWRSWMEVHGPYLGKWKLKSGDTDMMVHSRVHSGGPGASYGIFVLPIMSRGTPDQMKNFGFRGYNMKIVGGYAQTEIGHGSNVRGLETTATYIKATEEFVLDTPTLTSMKFWITNLGKLATHALVYAQLLIDGKEYGIHEFIVQIRDENHRPLPGVEVGDVGDKLGHDYSDTGFLRLDKVRVPRDRMLAKYQQVLPDGTYVKNEKKRNPVTHYYTMLATRASIVRRAAFMLARAVTIAVRYSAIRKQGFEAAEQGISHMSPEVCIMDYQVQRYRLFKQLSTAYAGIFGGRFLIEHFKSIGDIGQDVEKVKTAAAMTAGLKSMCTLATLDGIEDLRKCCGGHGFLKASGVADLLVEYMPNPTFEGDWIILYLQLARYLMKTVEDLKVSGKRPDGILDYLLPQYEADPSKGAEVSDYLTPTMLLRVLKHRARNDVMAAHVAFQKDLKKGLPWGDAWRANSILLVNCAKSHSRAFEFEVFKDGVESVKDADCKRVLETLVLCHGLSQIVDFQSGHVLTGGTTAAASALVDVMARIRPDAVALVDAFDFPDNSLGSVLGKFDGNVYEALYENTKRTSLNQADPFWGYEKHLKPFLDIKFLKRGNTPLKPQSNL
eukprot:118551_1